MAAGAPLPADGREVALPRSLASFVGRADELAALAGLLDDPTVRLLTLTGPGGVGKTRLAIEAVAALAARTADRFADGVRFVDCAALAGADQVLPLVAGELGLTEPTEGSVGEALSEHLGELDTLLLLDNLEQVVAVGPDLAALVRGCPGLTIVATSRMALRVAGEIAYPVPPLGLADGSAAGRPSDAAALFAARARAVRPAFALDARTGPVVEQVCRRLDGLPLAIELAASRLRLISAEALLARLSDRLRVLGDGPVDAPARQQTLTATIAWSEQLLEPEGQRLFRALGVFPETFGLDAVEAVGAVPDALDALSGLVDHALVQPVDTGGDEPRFRMLATVRGYALERLRAAGEEDAVRLRHRAHFRALAERAEPELVGPDQGAWFAALAREGDNLRQALVHAAADDDREDALRLIAALWRFWVTRGMLADTRTLIDAALDGQAQGTTALWARALRGAGIVAEVQGDVGRARAWDEAALAIWTGLGDGAGQALSLLDLGNVASNVGDLDAAGDAYARAAARAAAAGATRLEVLARAALGNVAARRGDDIGAAEQYRALVAMMRGLGDDESLARILANLGVVLARLGERAEARALHEESLVLNRALGDEAGIATALINLDAEVGAPGALAREALALATRIGHDELVGAAQLQLATVEIARGELASPAERLGQALAAFERAEMPIRAAEALDTLALALAETAPDRAARLLGGADGIRARHGTVMSALGAEQVAGLARGLRRRLGADRYAAERAAGRATDQAGAEMEARTAIALVTLGVAAEAVAAPPADARIALLSRREREVLRLIAEGCSDREIGEALFISPKTANHHVTHILTKLDSPNRAAAVALAARHGLVT